MDHKSRRAGPERGLARVSDEQRELLRRLTFERLGLRDEPRVVAGVSYGDSTHIQRYVTHE